MVEKPQYGWYVKGLIVGFSLFGLLGLGALIIGLLLKGLIGVILILTGVSIIILFLWPGIGMAVLNLMLNNRFYINSKMKALNEVKSPQILDIGCGTGRTAIKIAKDLKNGGHLYGIDIYKKIAISGNALETVQKNAQIEEVDDITTFQYGSATDIPFEDEIFDIVNVSSVLHEVHDDDGQKKALNEIYRVLKPQGYLCISEWNRYSWQTIAYCGIFCFVFKPLKYWLDLLKKHNFKDLKYENSGGFVFFEARK